MSYHPSFGEKIAKVCAIKIAGTFWIFNANFKWLTVTTQDSTDTRQSSRDNQPEEDDTAPGFPTEPRPNHINAAPVSILSGCFVG
jgi:hypothetical protein